jgi:hypothetical protein
MANAQSEMISADDLFNKAVYYPLEKSVEAENMNILNAVKLVLTTEVEKAVRKHVIFRTKLYFICTIELYSCF